MKSNHNFIMSPLVSKKNRKLFESVINTFDEWEKNNIKIFPIFLNMPNNNFKNLINPTIVLPDVINFIRTFLYIKPNVVIVSYLLDAYPVVFLKWIFKFSLVVIASGGDVNLHKGRLFHFVRNFVYRNSDFLFAVSNDLKNKIQRESGYEALVIPSGVDPNLFQPLTLFVGLREKWGFEDKDLIFLTVCNLVKHKGVDIGIKAIAILKKYGFKNLKFIIVGKGPEKKHLDKIISELNLNEEIIFLGHKSRKELVEIYNIANLFLLISSTEGLPFSLLEAMACETICLSTRVGDIPKVLIDKFNGFLMNSRDPKNVALKIVKILSLQKNIIYSVKGEARNTILNNYDFRKLTMKMLNIISY